MTKVIIFGGSGQLGKSLEKQSKDQSYDLDLKFFSKNVVDITSREDISMTINKEKPKFVINAAAFTNVDEAEKEKKDALLVNADSMHYLSSACKSIGSNLIHFSTDYVFDGDSKVPYKESDYTNPSNTYGMSKLEGEKIVMNSGCNYLIFRTSWVFSEFNQNFLKSMMEVSSKKTEVQIIGDQTGSPTYALDIAKMTLEIVSILNKSNNEQFKKGIYHFCSNESCSWFEFGVYIFETLKKNGYKVPERITKIKAEDYTFSKVKRPKYSVLDCMKIYQDFGIIQPNWKDGVKSVIPKLLE